MFKKIVVTLLAAFAVAAGAKAQLLEITEIYGAGGNSGATGMSDYIELYNPSTSPIDLSTYSLQYASATGNFGLTASVFTVLSGTLQPQDYFLIKLSTGTTGTAVPTADFTDTSINLAATAGKVAISNQTTTAITGPTDASVVDFVGYGTTANGFKGTGPAPAPSTTTSISRSTLTGPSTSNNTDFAAGALSPTNSSFNPSGVPEPSSYACLIGGVVATVWLRLRRRAI